MFSNLSALLFSDGATVEHQPVSPDESPVAEMASTRTAYKPTHLLATLKTYIDYIAEHIERLEGDAKEDIAKLERKNIAGERFLQALQTLTEIQNIRKVAGQIRAQTVLYSTDLHIGIVAGLPGSDSPEDQEEFFVDVPSTITSVSRGFGQSQLIHPKSFVVDPHYVLPPLISCFTVGGPGLHEQAYKALASLYLLYKAVEQWLFNIKENQLRDFLAAPGTYRLDTYAFDAAGERLPELINSQITADKYKELDTVANLLLPVINLQIQKTASRKAIKVDETTAMYEAKQEVYGLLKQIIDKDNKATRGIKHFHAIIYTNNLEGSYSDERFKMLLDEAQKSKTRRFIGLFPPLGRSPETQNLYAGLSSFALHYNCWSLQDVEEMRDVLKNYLNKEIAPSCFSFLKCC